MDCVTATVPQADTDRPDYSALIQPERVHGSLYTDPRIFAEELERIWYRTWVYVGHESEVPQPGDYVRKNIGPQDLVMTRDREGQVHLLVNRCAQDRKSTRLNSSHVKISYAVF